MSPGFLSVRPQDWATITPIASGTLLVAAGDVLSKSTNGGDAWTTLVTGANSLVFDVTSDGQSIYAVEAQASVNEIVHKSLDGGATWSTIGPIRGTSHPAIDGVAVADASLVYVAYDDGEIWFTANGGSSWAQTTSLVDAFFPLRTTAGKLWTGSLADFGNTVYQMNHDGSSSVTYTVAAHNVHPVSDALAFAYDGPYESTSLFRLTSGSATDITPSGSLSGGWFFGADSPDGTVICAIVTDGINAEMWRSIDSGATWAKVHDDIQLAPFDPLLGIMLAVDDSNTARWFSVGLTDTLWRSMDSGVTWTQIAGPGDTVTDLRVVAA